MCADTHSNAVLQERLAAEIAHATSRPGQAVDPSLSGAFPGMAPVPDEALKSQMKSLQQELEEAHKQIQVTRDPFICVHKQGCSFAAW